MKEKRYFCDYMNSREDAKLPILIVLLSFFVITSVCGSMHFNRLLSKHENELNSYSESTYEYLDKIADNVIQKGVGINLLALPDDVVEYEITNQDNEVIFKYYLDNNKGMRFAVSADMTIKLSDKFEIISKEPNYSSEEDYISDIKFSMIFYSILIGFANWIVFMLVVFGVLYIAILISQANKNKNLS